MTESESWYNIKKQSFDLSKPSAIKNIQSKSSWNPLCKTFNQTNANNKA